jgi:hypothetical protein
VNHTIAHQEGLVRVGYLVSVTEVDATRQKTLRLITEEDATEVGNPALTCNDLLGDVELEVFQGRHFSIEDHGIVGIRPIDQARLNR